VHVDWRCRGRCGVSGRSVAWSGVGGLKRVGIVGPEVGCGALGDAMYEGRWVLDGMEDGVLEVSIV
jgi:hypothetical protein